MRVMEIFKSIDGEVNAFGQGVVSTFVRFAGCNLACPYCDTKESRSIDSGLFMTPEAVAEHVGDLNCQKVTLTGGEPLLQDDLMELIVILRDNGHTISIETNGTRDLTDTANNADSVIMNYKKQSPPLPNNYNVLNATEKGILKIMVEDHDQLNNELERFIKEISFYFPNIGIALSPVHGEVSVDDILEFIDRCQLAQDNLISVNVQLHKLLNIK